MSYFLAVLILLAFLSFAFFSPQWYVHYPVYHYAFDFVAGAVFFRLLIRRYLQRSQLMPPVNAEFLFYLFLDACKCHALVGDLEERYKLIYAKFGARRANFWYWTQALRSVGPIVWTWAKKAALKPVLGIITWTVAKGLVGHESWLAALLEIWKGIRS